MSPMKVSSIVTLLLASVSLGFEYDEAVQGDLPDNGQMPLELTPTLGENLLSGGLHGEDDVVDSVLITVPPGWELASIINIACTFGEEYDLVVLSGVHQDMDSWSANPDLIAWGHPTWLTTGDDMLWPWSPLGPGTYTVAAVYDEGASAYTLGFHFGDPSIPAVSTWGLVILGILVLTCGTVGIGERKVSIA